MTKWIKVDKQMPDAETLRAVVSVHGGERRAWFSKGQWYEYDGTFFLTEKNKIDGVTHWLPIDWMTSKEWPQYAPGLRNRMRYFWQRLIYGAQDMAYDLRPNGWGKTAQMSKKPVFYKDSSGKIMSGMPESIPAPKGYEKIVCGSALEAERYSSMQRQQERFEHRAEQERRGAIEAEFIGQIRSDRRTLIANARNNRNRDFLRRAEEMSAGRQDPTAYERESHLHAEAFEDRH
jgi:hypothetical protein